MANATNPENKKLTKAHIFLLVGVLAAFIIYGLYEVVWKTKLNGTTLIDNPTGKPLAVTIDGTDYEIPANSFEKIDLEIGHHKISCKAYQIADQDLHLDPTEYGVINPTKSKYVIYNIIYTKKDLSSKFKAYQVEGKEIYSLLGEPEVTTALFIPDRTLGKGNIDDKEPAFENYNRVNQDYAFLTKIFRLNDFFEFYDKNNK
ncbi:hypothetical protein [Pedobacter agri]|uniref:Uncharacterized protein n=1 Tax=Pedobacter agri TaxID=454586 RepID=A0A9X3I7A0_9SPHI|nr:hypothetical protein [Pedobacter agri]MCX3263547.1 hypothetical protein [Pedobacter agri]